MQISIPSFYVWPILGIAIIGTTFVLAHFFFVRRKVRATIAMKMLVGSLGAIVPAIAIAFGKSGNEIEIDLWDGIFVALIIMGFWGTSFGALLTGFFASKIVPEEVPPEEAFK